MVVDLAPADHEMLSRRLRKEYPNTYLVMEPVASSYFLLSTFSRYSNAYPFFVKVGYTHRLIHGLSVLRPLRRRLSLGVLKLFSHVTNPAHWNSRSWLPPWVKPEDVDLVLVVDPVVCRLNLRIFRNAVKIYWAQDCVYEKTRYMHLTLLSGSDYDHVLVAHRGCIKEYEELTGAKVSWLPYAFYPEIHRPLGLEETLDLSFLGGLDWVGAEKRRRIIELIRSKRPGLRFYVSSRNFLNHMVAIYNMSKVVLNISRIGEMNWRDFEVLGCGRPMIRDYSAEVSEIFSDGEHLVMFRDEEDLLEKIDELIRNKEKRERIALKGRQEALEKHTLDHRVGRILEIAGLLDDKSIPRWPR